MTIYLHYRNSLFSCSWTNSFVYYRDCLSKYSENSKTYCRIYNENSIKLFFLDVETRDSS